MPTYNSDQYLAEAIQTLLDQTHKDFEVIVQDDGSTDNTDILMDYFVKKDKRVKYFKNGRNLGIAKTRNNGFSHSSGEYIAICDSDEIYHPSRLKMSLRAIQKADIVFSPMLNADADGKVFDITEVPNKLTIELLRKDQQIPIITVMATRKVFEENPYEDQYKSNDDRILIYKWFLADYKWKKIDTPLVIHRHHMSSVSVRKNADIVKYNQIARDIFESELKKKGEKWIRDHLN
jgi:glycosyltransferase involved in cell wall biosynthesis